MDAVITGLRRGGVDHKGVLPLGISRRYIAGEAVRENNGSVTRHGRDLLARDKPNLVGVAPVGSTGVLFPDIEALADQLPHLIRRAGDDQCALVYARAVGGNSGGVEVLRLFLHTSDADIEDLQLEGLPAGSGIAAQLHRLGEGQLIPGRVVGVGKLRFFVIHIIFGIMNFEIH